MVISKDNKIIIVLGTRPEIIKLSTIIPELNPIVINTGQHYDDNMNKSFFEELELPNPKYSLNLKSKQLGQILGKIEEIFIKEKPNLVIVQGDTNSTLAGGLMATKLKIPLMHIESGCRSGNLEMPEEKNRIIVDHISDYLIAADEYAAVNLIKEGLGHKIKLIGNTGVEATLRSIRILNSKR